MRIPKPAARPSRTIGKRDIDGNKRDPIHSAINKTNGETRMCACARIQDHYDSEHGTWQDTHPTLF